MVEHHRQRDTTSATATIHCARCTATHCTASATHCTASAVDSTARTALPLPLTALPLPPFTALTALPLLCTHARTHTRAHTHTCTHADTSRRGVEHGMGYP
jgi:hypothetical protein